MAAKSRPGTATGGRRAPPTINLNKQFESSEPDLSHVFNVGDRVVYQEKYPGTVAWVGVPLFAPGVWVGVIFTAPVSEGHNGAYRGKQYFKAPSQCGRFFRPEALEHVYNPSRTFLISKPRFENGEDPTEVKVGARVIVRERFGTVRFLGQTLFGTGVWAGVEMDQPIVDKLSFHAAFDKNYYLSEGTNDGRIGTTQYFSCEAKRALFVRPDAITVATPDALDAHERREAEKIAQIYADPPPKVLKRVNSATLEPLKPKPEVEEAPEDPEVSRLVSLMDRRIVTTCGKFGRVRFVGRAAFAPGVWIGVELEAKLTGRQRYNNGVRQGVQYFNCRPGNGDFFRPIGVKLVEDAVKPSTDIVAASPQQQAASTTIQRVVRGHLERKGTAPSIVLAGESPFSAVDADALRTPRILSSVEALAETLMSKAPTAMARARAIYSWILANIEFDEVSMASLASVPIEEMLQTQSPETVLRTKRCLSRGYAALFNALARAMGLEAEIIAGFCKYYGFEPGSSFPLANCDHFWNAVRIDREWKLVDCTWASGKFHTDEFSFSHDKDEFRAAFFFCPPPEQLIYSHLPVDEQWQMIDKPLSLAEFEAQAFPQAAFFQMHMRLEDPRMMGVIKPTGPEHSFKILFEPPYSCENAMLSVRLRTSGVDRIFDSGSQFYDDFKASRWGFVQSVDGSHWDVLLTFPEGSREYTVEVRARNPARPQDAEQLVLELKLCPGANLRTLTDQPGVPATKVPWTPGFYVWSPLRECLQINKAVHFKVKVPFSESVEILAKGAMLELQRSQSTKPDSEFLYEGTIRFNEVGFANVVARGLDGSEQAVLQYRIVPAR